MRSWGVLWGIALIYGILIPSDAIAQVPFVGNTTDTPIPSSGHDYLADLSEIVNPADGSLSIRVAAPPQKERGAGMPHYVFVYDSYIGSPIPAISPGGEEGLIYEPPRLVGITTARRQDGEFVVQVAGAYGWPNSITAVRMTANYTNDVINGCPGPNCLTIAFQQNYVYTDPQGGRHNLDLRWDALPGNTQGEVGNLASLGYPEILSGGDQQYHASLNDTTGQVTVVDNHGTVLLPSFEDSNGNGPDGTGRTYSTVLGTGANAGRVIQETVPGVTGVYTISWAQTVANFTITYDGDPCGSWSSTYTPSSLDMDPQSLTLPDGRQYKFGYDSTYGVINSITYPNGVVVSYTWTMQPAMQAIGFNGPCYISNGNIWSPRTSVKYDWPTITRRVVSLNGGATPILEQDFSYNTMMVYNGYWGWSTKSTKVTTTDLARGGVVDSMVTYAYWPAAYVSGRTGFSYWWGIQESPQEAAITTQDGSGSLVKTETKSWNGVNQLAGDCVTPANAGTSGEFYKYQPGPTIGGLTAIYPTELITDKAEYNNGLVSSASCQQPSTAPTRETVTTYQSFSSTPIFPSGPSILDRPQSVQIYDNGSLEAQTDYSYDEYSVTPGPGNVIEHDECNYGLVPPSGCSAPTNVPRGNVTSLKKHCFVNCSDVTTHTWYDETGQVSQTVDGNSNPPTMYSYADAFDPNYGTPPSGQTNTYLTLVTMPSTNGASHKVSWTYAYYNGQIRTSTDQNNNQTAYCYLVGGCLGSSYEPWGRLTESDQPGGLGKTSITYYDAGYAPYVTTTTEVSSAPLVQKITTTTMDGLGRKTSVNVQGGPSASTRYDGLSRVYQQSNLYITTSDPTYGLYKYTYDALGRLIRTDDPDSNFSTNTYNGYVVTYTDESHHVWTRTYDALGRLLQVLEPNNSNVPTFITTYTYDALNDLKTVTQNGNPSSGDIAHNRQFSYNGLGQLQSATNPESGTINYSYDLNGNLTQTVDAKSVTVTYGYDALNRLLSKTFAGGNTTLPVGYDYDLGSTSGGNYIGRLADEYTGSQATPVTRRVILGYDVDGRETGEQQCLLGSCSSTSPVLNYSYNLAGDISSWAINIAGGGATITNTYDAADRLASVSSNYSGNPANPTAFDVTHPDKLFSAEQSGAYGPMGLANPQYGILTSGGVNGQAAISGAITYDNRARVTSAIYSNTGATQ